MNVFQRLRDALGLEEPYDEYDYYEEGEANPAEPLGNGGGSLRRSPHGNVVGIPGMTMEMVMMQPFSFEEVPKAVMALRERKSVILDLTLMDVEQAQRCADYVAGGAFAIDGHQRQLGPNVFLFTPNFVHISHYQTGEVNLRPEREPQ